MKKKPVKSTVRPGWAKFCGWLLRRMGWESVGGPMTEKKAIVNRRHGQPPMQELASAADVAADDDVREEIDETFYGDEGFEAEELDMEGYEIDE